MTDNYHKATYTFRLVGITKSISDRFISEFGDMNLQHKVNKYFKDKSKFVITMPFSKRIPVDKMIKFIKENKLSRSKYGLCCYLTSNRDMDGITVQEDILDFYEKVGGTIDFSYIFCT